MPRIYDYDIIGGQPPLLGPIAFGPGISATPIASISVPPGLTAHAIIEYSMSEDTGTESTTGILKIAGDGVSIINSNDDRVNSPVFGLNHTFSVLNSGAGTIFIDLLISSSSTVYTCQFKYYIKQWTS